MKLICYPTTQQVNPATLLMATSVTEMTTADGELIVISEHNPYHAKDGKFTTGPGGGGKSMLDDSMSTEEFDKYSKTYGGSMSAHEKELLLDYQNSEARPINFNLRDAEGKIDKQSLAIGTGKLENTTEYFINTTGGRRAEVVKLMDSKMQHKLKTDTALYRGVSIDANLKPGSILKTPGYSSTSFSKDLAATFTFNGIRPYSDNTQEYVLRIVAPKGTRGLIPHTYTGGRTIEQEFIMPRNTNLKITKVIGEGTTESGSRYTPSYRYTIVEAELI